jgi:drug/metabolite transporter (DMT)-like permease
MCLFFLSSDIAPNGNRPKCIVPARWPSSQLRLSLAETRQHNSMPKWAQRHAFQALMKTRYFLQLVALSALWGSGFMLSRIAAPQLGPNLMATIRMGLATMVLGTLMRIFKYRWPLQHWREVVLLGLLAVAGPHTLYAWSALYLPAGYGALLTVTSVLFGAFASAYWKEEVLTPAKLIGCALGFAGAALVVRLGPVQPTAKLLAAAVVCVCGAALSGIATPLLKRALKRMQPLEVTAGMHGAAFLIMIPGAAYDWPHASFTFSALGSVAIMGITTSGLAYWLYMRIMRHVPPMAALSSTFMSTGFGIFWAVLLLHEETSAAMFAGGALIVTACILVTGINPLRRAS